MTAMPVQAGMRFRLKFLSVVGSRFARMDSEAVTDVVTGLVSDVVAGLDGTTCAQALVDSQARLVEAEVAQVLLVAHWCDLFSGPTPVESGALPAAVVVPGMERSV